MPRFYFDLRDGEAIMEDSEGAELPCVRAARDEAVRALTEVVRGRTFDSDAIDFTFLIRDIGNAIVLTAKLSLLVSYPE